MKHKRALALTGAVILVLLYVSTLVFALLKHPLATNLLSASLFCTVVVPGFLYGYQLVIRYFRNRGSDE